MTQNTVKTKNYKLSFLSYYCVCTIMCPVTMFTLQNFEYKPVIEQEFIGFLRIQLRNYRQKNKSGERKEKNKKKEKVEYDMSCIFTYMDTYTSFIHSRFQVLFNILG